MPENKLLACPVCGSALELEKSTVETLGGTIDAPVVLKTTRIFMVTCSHYCFTIQRRTSLQDLIEELTRRINRGD